jgi:chloramphenicol-sensitive protein RarD
MPRSTQPSSAPDSHSALRPVLLGSAAFAFWGLSPLFWRLLAEIPAQQQFAHRILWSLPSLWALILLRGHLPELRRAFSDRRTLLRLFAAGALLGVNWFTFIYAVATERLLDASLGYYITPLVNVMLGAVFLGERLRAGQRLAIALVVLGVALRTFDHGKLPWIAVALATSFGLYGLVKKTSKSAPIVGLSVEILPIVPFAIGYLLLTMPLEHAISAGNAGQLALLLCTGPVTVIPLLLFGAAAQRIRLATIGILQYIAPTLQFAIATLIFAEPFQTVQLISFALVWTALAIYLFESQRLPRKRESDGLRRGPRGPA